MINLDKYKNILVIVTIVYFALCYVVYTVAGDDHSYQMVYHAARAIGFYIIMYHYYKYYKLKYKSNRF